MNLQTAIAATLNARRPAARAASRQSSTASLVVRRERDFGVGYGNSSGYASDKRYVRDWGNARFRFA